MPTYRKGDNMSYQNYNIDLLHLQDKSFDIINVEKQIINGVETLIIEVKKILMNCFVYIVVLLIL